MAVFFRPTTDNFLPVYMLLPGQSGPTVALNGYKRTYSLFILVMCILLQRISDPHDFVKYISGKMTL